MTNTETIAVDADVYSRLDAYLQHHEPGLTASQAGSTFIDEALRRLAHPDVVFKPGPTGRRAALAAGPDIWEIVTAARALTADDDNPAGEYRADALAEVTGLDRHRIDAAMDYYRAYPREIDDRINANERAADAALRP